MSTTHIGVQVQALASLLLIQLPVNSPAKAMEDGKGTLVPDTHWMEFLAPDYSLDQP